MIHRYTAETDQIDYHCVILFEPFCLPEYFIFTRYVSIDNDDIIMAR